MVAVFYRFLFALLTLIPSIIPFLTFTMNLPNLINNGWLNIQIPVHVLWVVELVVKDFGFVQLLNNTFHLKLIINICISHICGFLNVHVWDYFFFALGWGLRCLTIYPLPLQITQIILSQLLHIFIFIFDSKKQIYSNQRIPWIGKF